MFMSGYNMAFLILKSTLRSIVIFLIASSFLGALFVPRLVIVLQKGDIQEERDAIKAELQAFTSRDTDRRLSKAVPPPAPST